MLASRQYKRRKIETELTGVHPFITVDSDMIQVVFARNPIRLSDFEDGEREDVARIMYNIEGERFDLYPETEGLADHGRVLPIDCFSMARREHDMTLKQFFQKVIRNVDNFCNNFTLLGVMIDITHGLSNRFCAKCVLLGDSGVSAKVDKRLFVDLDECDGYDFGLTYNLFVYIDHNLEAKIVKSRHMKEMAILKHMFSTDLLERDYISLTRPKTWPVVSRGAICHLGVCYSVPQNEAEYDVSLNYVSFPLLYVNPGEWITL